MLAALACHFPAIALVKYDLNGGRLRSFPYYLGFEDGLAGEDYEHPLDLPALELFDASGKPATEAEAQSELRAVTSTGEVRMDMANISSSFYLNMKDEAGARATCAKFVRSFDNLKAEEASARQALDEFPALQAQLSELLTGPGIVFARWVAELVDSNVVLKWIFLLRSDEDAIFSSTPPRQYCELDEVTRRAADAVMQRDGGFMRLPPHGINADEAEYDIPGLKQRVYELAKKSKPDEELMTSARLMAEAAEAALRAMDQLCAEGRKEAIAADALEALLGTGSKVEDREGAVPSDHLLDAKGSKMTSCLLRFSSQDDTRRLALPVLRRQHLPSATGQVLSDHAGAPHVAATSQHAQAERSTVLAMICTLYITIALTSSPGLAHTRAPRRCETTPPSPPSRARREPPARSPGPPPPR